MDAMDKLRKVLVSKGWVLLPIGKHMKYRSPCGKHVLVMSRSPSCQFAVQKNLRMLRKLGFDYRKECGL